MDGSRLEPRLGTLGGLADGVLPLDGDRGKGIMPAPRVMATGEGWRCCCSCPNKVAPNEAPKDGRREPDDRPLLGDLDSLPPPPPAPVAEVVELPACGCCC